MEALSPATSRAYLGDWRGWARWCRARDAPARPVDPVLLAEHLTDLAAERAGDGSPRLRTSTLARRVAALAHHDRRFGPDLASYEPADLRHHPAVVAALGLAAARGGSAPTVRPDPLHRDDVARVLGSMSHHTWPHGVAAARDTLVLLLAAQGGVRRAHLPDLDVAALRNLSALCLRHDTAPPCLCSASRRWLSLLGAEGRVAAMRVVLDRASSTDPARPPVSLPAPSVVLRRVRPDGSIGVAPLADGSVNRMLKRRAEGAGLDPARFTYGALRRLSVDPRHDGSETAP